jgi:ABC-2 type transport system permease protein
VAIAAGCLIGGLPASGSWLLAAACGTTGLAFVGIAFALAQVFPTSRAANSWAAALAVIAYFVRGIGDAAGTPHPATYSLTPAWPSWLSPIGWAQATLPYAENRVWPLLLGLGTFVVLAAVGLALQERRDLGAGLVAERRSRSTAPATLLGSFGLALRLERWGLIGWLVGLVALAGLLGALSGVVVHQLNDAGPGVANAIDAIGGSNGTLSQAFANLGAGFSGLLAAAICVQGAQRLRQEEAAGSADTALATATGRVRWMLSFLGVAAVGAVLSLLLGGLVAGASAGDSGIGFGTWLAAYLWEVPAVLVFLGIGAVLFAVWPRGAIATGWLLVALAAFLGLFGPLVGVPEWARRLAPFAHTPAVALPDPSYVGGVVMSVLAAALLAAGVVLFRLRDTRPVG